jgi:hypothetical protein
MLQMTLEHIDRTAEFVSMVRRSIQSNKDVVSISRSQMSFVFSTNAHSGYYYEHCSYFSPGSLSRLFNRCGFDVIGLKRGYQDQYLMIEARLADRARFDIPVLVETVPH